jgi:hypothetical protein
MSDINELGVDEQFTRKVRKIAMTSKFDLSEQLDSQSTRRTVVATGVKLAYAAPIVAASLKVSTLSAYAAVTPGAVNCFHSLPDPGTAGCMGACQRSGDGCGASCQVICNVLCPNIPGAGNDRECLDVRACLDASFENCDFLFD